MHSRLLSTLLVIHLLKKGMGLDGKAFAMPQTTMGIARKNINIKMRKAQSYTNRPLNARCLLALATAVHAPGIFKFLFSPTASFIAEISGCECVMLFTVSPYLFSVPSSVAEFTSECLPACALCQETYQTFVVARSD